ncbi:ATP synthase subunit I [Paenibacillus sp. 481]|uniref:ATP synthase subunit I n=1 Tax=Paenibacillus sp. 481 TaxID=2835869 RepID=UPI001E441658|nr:ATP synthase subunit I [Paenibacillus sp. 481]UHA75657.1 ATP synthase subunit I [Paenibacillus sp. 481]
MDEFTSPVRKVIRIGLYAIAACVLFGVVAAQYRTIANGLALGIVVSLINTFLLAKKIHIISHMVETGQHRRVNLGFITRASVAILAMLLAYNNAYMFSVVATMFGFPFATLAHMVLTMFAIRKK